MSSLAASPVVERRVRVLAVDDQPLSLALLRDVVRATSRLALIGEADSGERAVEVANELQPDVVLMDVHMPGVGGIEAARRIRARWPATLIVLISTTHPDDLPRAVETSGANAVIWKSELQPKVLDAIWLQWHGGRASE